MEVEEVVRSVYGQISVLTGADLKVVLHFHLVREVFKVHSA